MGCGMDTMPPPAKDWIKDFLATPVNHVPGTTYMYNSMGSTLLGAIVRKRTGEGLHEYLTPRLFNKIGIDPDNLLWMYMPDGMEIGGGGLFATTEDNLRLMKLYADGGVWDGERILAKQYVQYATTLQNESATEARNNPEATDNFVGYGFQIWMCKPEGVYRADGAMGQFAIVSPHLDMIISINETAPGASGAQHTLDAVWEFLAEVEAGGTRESDDKATKLSERMAALSLPAPAYAPYSPTVRKIDKKEFIMDSGAFGFEDPIGAMMSGRKPSEGIRRFSFRFAYDCCYFDFVQDDQTHCAGIATDGTRRLNIIKLESSAAVKLLLSGAWTEENIFSMTARWIETCFEKRIDFTFSDDGVHIKKENTVGGFGPFGHPEEDTPVIARIRP
jgi:hypothetical protein